MTGALIIQANQGAFDVQNSTGTSIFFVNTTSKNVGIGTATPQNLLNVLGDANITGTIFWGSVNVSNFNISMKSYVDSLDTSTNTTIASYVDSVNNSLATWATAEIILANTSAIAYVDSQDVVFNNSLKAYLDGQDIIFNNTLKAYLDGQDTIFNNSISVWATGDFVDVAGDTMTGNLIINTNLTVDTSDFFVNSNTGNVGIGTSSPQQRLEVAGRINITSSGGVDHFQLYDTGSVSYIQSEVNPLYLDSFADLRIQAKNSGQDIYIDAGDFIKFRHDGTDVMIIYDN